MSDKKELLLYPAKMSDFHFSTGRMTTVRFRDFSGIRISNPDYIEAGKDAQCALKSVMEELIEKDIPLPVPSQPEVGDVMLGIPVPYEVLLSLTSSNVSHETKSKLSKAP